MNNRIPHWRKLLQEHPRCADDRRATLKIILKTRDENLLLQDWISHHANIVGYENLLILDNLSTDQDVLGIYDRYSSIIPIGAFDGFVDNPHSKSLFAPLYDWLAETTAYYILLDTDERLIWAENDFYLHDWRIVEKLARLQAASALAGAWLYNQPGSRTQFCFGSKGGLADGLCWGKPILSTKANRPDKVIHNCQAAALFDRPVTNFFVLHLSRLSAVQRIKANANKLRSYSIISNEDGLDAIAEINLASVRLPALRRLIQETLKLLEVKEHQNPADQATPYAIIFKDGAILYHNFEQRRLLQEFITDGATYLADCQPA